jgi:diguanylate cyclase (GGDEF)-like protein
MYGDKPLGPITISAGIAVFPAHGSTSQQIMGAADAALYQAKKGGRDCVVVTDGVPEPTPSAVARSSGA